MKSYSFYSLLILMLWSVILPMPSRASTITACDFDTLKTAIQNLNDADGGIITFDCEGVIRFTEMLLITADITLNGAGEVILDGYGLYTLFEVRGTLTLNNIIIQKGWTAIDNRGTLTITDSLFRDNLANSRGGAIISSGTLTITNSTFIGNETDEGGAIWNSGIFTITDSQLMQNIAYSYGGAIYNAGTMTIVSSQFDENRARRGDGGAVDNQGNMTIQTSTFTNHQGYSGGVVMNTGNLKIEDSVFHNNLANSGGGVFYTSGKLVILNSQFTDNSAGWGGVIATLGDTTIYNSYFEGNHARRSGGVITKWAYWDMEEGFLLNISHSTFIGNYANEEGGVLEYQNTTQVFIHNNTFVNNVAESGGAIYGKDKAEATIAHNTFVDNEGIGGAIYTDSPADIRYNLLSGTSQTEAQCDGAYEQAVNDTNLTDGTCGDARRMDDLMLGEFDGRVFPLLEHSPAIDYYMQPCLLVRDQLGSPRPRANACDIGAVEWLSADDPLMTQPQSLIITDCTTDAITDAVIQLGWVGGDIRLACPADMTITFGAPLFVDSKLTIISDTPIRFDGGNRAQLFVIGVTGDLTLSGMTLINGYHQTGGTIYNDGRLHLSHMTFSQNKAQKGGAIWNMGQLTITHSHFDQNTAQTGGAVYNRGQMTVTDSTFIDNYTDKSGEDKFKPFFRLLTQYEERVFTQVGGAIFTDGQTRISTSHFENNWANEAGGALFVDKNGVLHISDSHFSLNEAHSGGALYYLSNPKDEPLGNVAPHYLSQPSTKDGDYRYKPMAQQGRYHSIYDSVFEANKAHDGGAIYNTVWLSFYIRRNLFMHNEAVDRGGAIYTYGSSNVSQNTFIENHADKGGALFRGYGMSNTFLRNRAITEGGAVYGGGIAYSTFVDNTAPAGGAVYNTNLLGSIIIGDAPQCQGHDNPNRPSTNFATTPCINATVMPIEDLLLGEFDGWVFPLLPNSPLIDALSTCEQYFYNEHRLPDQLGTSRPQGDGCDVGAVEFVPDMP